MVGRKLTTGERLALGDRFGARDFHLNALEFFDDKIGIAGKRVLELAGSDLPREIVLETFGAASWTCIDDPGGRFLEHQKKQKPKLSKHYDTEKFILIEQADPSLVSLDYLVLLGDAASLPAWLYGKFDLILSIAGFEHIQNLPKAVDDAHMALTDLGRLGADFGPIWSSVSGHHINNFVDRAGNRVDWNLKTCPIPPWGHLLFEKDELGELLREYIGENNVPSALNMIYGNGSINHLFSQDYFNIFVNSKFNSFSWFKYWSRKPDQEIQERLEKLYPGRTEFSQASVRVILQR
jgi:hypothetical protein